MLEVLASILLAAFFYVVILICFKIMGKREINQLSSVDIVINILIANIAASGIVEEKFWMDAFGGVVVIVLLQVIMAKIQIGHPKIRDMVDGEPSMIIKNGRIDYGELRKLRIDLDDFMMMLRGETLVSPEDIQYGIVERNGKLTVFERKMPTKVFPLPLVVSGKVKPEALKSFGQTQEWLDHELNRQEMPKLSKIELLLYEDHKLVVFTNEGMQKIKVEYR